VVGIRFATPAEQELLCGAIALRDHVVPGGLAPVVDGRRAGDDRHHLRRETAEVVARLVVVDVHQLGELPDAREARGLGLEIGRRVAGQLRRLVRLGFRHSGLETLVHEQAPDLLVVEVADQRLDIDAAIAELSAFAVGLHDLGLERNDAGQAGLELVHRPGIYR